MAESPNPIVWGNWKQTAAGNDLGATVHYYDTKAQFIYLIEGIKTRTGTIENGDWENNTWNTTVSIDDTKYQLLSIDHPSNGTLYGVACTKDALYFLRYVYSMEIGDLITSGTWSANNNSEIQQCSVTITNIKNVLYEKRYSLYQPGGRLVIKVCLGDSDPYDIGVAHLDEVSFDPMSPTVSATGRNKTGFFLKDTAIGGLKETTGSYSGVLYTLLNEAGVLDAIVETKTDECVVKFENPKMKILDAIKNVCAAINYEMRELPDGRIAVGTPEWIAETFQAQGYYQFDGGREVFRRKTQRMADAAYSQVWVMGKTEDNQDLTPARFDIPTYDNWNVPKQKIYFVDAPQGFTENDMAAYAQELRDAMQYAGITETFESPFRPQLLIGDVAQVFYEGDEEAETLGTITSIRHNFGERGFSTTFTVDSGGTVREIQGDEDVKVISKSKYVSGYGSMQKITDIVHRTITNTRL